MTRAGKGCEIDSFTFYAKRCIENILCGCSIFQDELFYHQKEVIDFYQKKIDLKL